MYSKENCIIDMLGHMKKRLRVFSISVQLILYMGWVSPGWKGATQGTFAFDMDKKSLLY